MPDFSYLAASHSMPQANSTALEEIPPYDEESIPTDMQTPVQPGISILFVSRHGPTPISAKLWSQQSEVHEHMSTKEKSQQKQNKSHDRQLTVPILRDHGISSRFAAMHQRRGPVGPSLCPQI